MAFDLKNYYPDQVLIVFNGITLSNGLMDGTFVSIAPEADLYASVAGVDGEVARSRNNDKRHTMKLTLMQTSSENLKLSIISNLDKISPLGEGVGALMIQEGNSLYIAEKAWISREPDVVYSNGIEGREWSFQMASLTRVDGGN